jgi:hypothetical protein
MRFVQKDIGHIQNRVPMTVLVQRHLEVWLTLRKPATGMRKVYEILTSMKETRHDKVTAGARFLPLLSGVLGTSVR